MSQDEQLISHLIAARDLLTPENWRKKYYFQTELGNPNICMCAHGALQVQVNPACRKAYKENNALGSMISRGAAGESTEAENTKKSNPSQSLQQLWDNRSDRLKQDYIFGSVNCGKWEIHYLLGLVGLTTSFNDHPDTTLEMVKAKFDEAIQLARTLN